MLIAVLFAPAASALTLAPPGPYRDIASDVRYVTDPAHELTVQDVRTMRRADELSPVSAPHIDFGFTRDTVWLVLPVTNPEPHDAMWILSFNMRFMQRMTVWADRGGRLVRLMENNASTPFKARMIPYRYVAMPIRLAADESVDLYVEYWSEGTTALPISFETQASFDALRSFHAIKNVAFYTFVAFMLIYAVLFAVVVRSRVFVFYAFYLGTVAFYLLHMDGYTFRYLWPNLPLWNAAAALPLGLMLNVSAALFSMAFLDTRARFPRMHRLLIGVVVVTLTYIAADTVLDPSQLKKFAFPYTFACSLVFLGCGIYAYRRRRIGVRFYVVGWFGLAAAALFTTFAHWSAGSLVVGTSFDLIRIGLLLDATMMALAVFEQFTETRKARASESERRAQLSEAMLGLQHRLTDLESSYQRVSRRADELGNRLATASHDLRQPLASMRMSLRSVAADASLRNVMNDTLGYLEGLLARYMDAAAQDGARESELSIVEEFPARLVLDNLRVMFAGEAAANHAALVTVPSSARVRTDPLVLVRVLGNALSNAIKHARASRILLGCRRGTDQIEFVVADDGAGMQASAPSAGHGYGLGIIEDLCQAHGFELRIDTQPGRGTRVGIRVPRAPDRSAK